MNKPLAIDLFAGLGGWTEGLVAEGWRVVGFDIERHVYGEQRYPAQLVLQDVLTLHGAQFRAAELIVASPPCQAFSYMAMPWSRAKAMAEDYRSGKRDVRQLTALFDACFRIQREACEAAGRHIPMVVENVRGAQPWVGRSQWAYGSYHLWGDVPALMPMTGKAKMPGFNFSKDSGAVWGPHHREAAESVGVEVGRKNSGGSWFNIGSPGQKETGRNPVQNDGFKNPGFRFDGDGRSFQSESVGRHVEGVKQRGSGREWFAGDGKISRLTSSKIPARKAASAQIAKIPLPLARHIARVWFPVGRSA